jgi:hypothetical protein
VLGGGGLDGADTPPGTCKGFCREGQVCVWCRRTRSLCEAGRVVVVMGREVLG